MNGVPGGLEVEHRRETTIFNILPEIWTDIIKNLSPTDFHSLINSSSKIREDLKSERIKRLLPLILPIVQNNQGCFDSTTFLDLRRVNQETQLALDTLLKEECCPEYWNYINVFLNYLELPWRPWLGGRRLTGNCDYVTIDDLDLGLEEISNPFLARPLHINIAVLSSQTPEEQEQFFNFLRRTGHNVTHLKCSHLRSIRLVFSVLPLVPNLRLLKLYTEQDVEDKEQFLKPVHYPPLPQLEFLDVEGFYDHDLGRENTRLNVAFVRNYGPQLKMLNCSNTFFRGWWGLGTFYCRHLCNLQRLRVATVSDQALIALSQAHLPQLQEIRLSPSGLDSSLFQEEVSIQKVLNVINNFVQSLRHFYLYTPISMQLSVYESLTEGSMIPLPKLITFTTWLSNVQLDWFWPFIQLKCPNLQELRLMQGDRMDEAICKELHLLLQNKGFELAPKLKTIWVAYRFFTASRTPMWIQITQRSIDCHQTYEH